MPSEKTPETIGANLKKICVQHERSSVISVLKRKATVTRHISKRCDIFLGVCKAVCNIFPKFTDIFCSHPSRMAAFFVFTRKSCRFVRIADNENQGQS